MGSNAGHGRLGGNVVTKASVPTPKEVARIAESGRRIQSGGGGEVAPSGGRGGRSGGSNNNAPDENSHVSGNFLPETRIGHNNEASDSHDVSSSDDDDHRSLSSSDSNSSRDPTPSMIHQLTLGVADAEQIAEEVRGLCKKHGETVGLCSKCYRTLTEDPTAATPDELTFYVRCCLGLQNISIDIGLASVHPEAGAEVRQLPLSMDLLGTFVETAVRRPLTLLSQLVPKTAPDLLRQLLIRSYQNACLIYEAITKLRVPELKMILSDLACCLARVEEDALVRQSLAGWARNWGVGTAGGMGGGCAQMLRVREMGTEGQGGGRAGKGNAGRNVGAKSRLAMTLRTAAVAGDSVPY